MTAPKPPKPRTPRDQRDEDERLDEQGRESFPASDPPAQPGIVGPHADPPEPGKPAGKP